MQVETKTSKEVNLNGEEKELRRKQLSSNEIAKQTTGKMAKAKTELKELRRQQFSSN